MPLPGFSSRTLPGAVAWIGLAMYVVGSDAVLILSESATMSEVFGGAVKCPVRKYPVIAAWGIVTVHLFLPRGTDLKRFDPIHQAGNLLARVRR